MNTNKVYVDVTAVFSKEGQLKPVSVKWQDGHIYEIQRITSVLNGRMDTFMRFSALQISGGLPV